MDTQLTAPPIPKVRTPVQLNLPADGQGNHNGEHVPVADHDQIDLNVPHPSRAWIIIAAVAGVVVLAALLAIGILPRQKNEAELAVAAQQELTAAIPVNVVKATRSDATMSVVLPGTLRPWQEVSIYARATGYLQKRNVDISEPVEKDQVMAVVSAPELDQQLASAKASVGLSQAAAAKAKADLELAELTDRRYESLRGTSGVTQQELDQYAANLHSAQAAFNQAKAQVDVAQANVNQLNEMVSFETIKAPFAGVVTGRAYDVGAFILANPTTAEIMPLFKIAQNDVLRAFINVPQNYSLTIEKGMKVDITARERPGKTYTGQVLGTTNYLDQAARSLLTEVRIENPESPGKLLPGMFVQATFKVTRDKPPLLIPAPALVINADGNQVAVVRDNKVHFQKVTLGVDYGNTIEIIDGLTGEEQIIGNPGEKTTEGAEVRIAR